MGKNNYQSILWIGSYQSDEIFQKMLARNIGQASGYASQKGIIKGFDEILKSDNYVLDTIGVIAYPAYPTYPKKYAERIEWSRTGITRDVNIGCTTVKYITYLSREHNLKNEVKKWAKERNPEKCTVIVYETYARSLSCEIRIKTGLSLSK